MFIFFVYKLGNTLFFTFHRTVDDFLINICILSDI
jgi:hypothetical protein